MPAHGRHGGRERRKRRRRRRRERFRLIASVSDRAYATDSQSDHRGGDGRTGHAEPVIGC
ncbi:MAG: hypothetical protein AB1631_01900 [Acidobacteriota bacterium]